MKGVIQAAGNIFLLYFAARTERFANVRAKATFETSLHLQSVFFGRLSYMETQKLAERLINYILFKVSTNLLSLQSFAHHGRT